jgi:hypothetical protein
MSGDGIRAYAGEFLISPAGLELSMNWCGHACTYCFANLFKPDRRADIRGIVGLLSEYRQRKSREAKLLQAGVPLLVSNHVDPFAGTNASQFEPIWELCVELGVPMTWQTRGAHKPQRGFLDRVIRETPRAVWYISIPMLDDDIRKRVEPHAPSIGSRLDLIDQLVAAGHVVTVGVNPLTMEWMPNAEPLMDLLKQKGVWGVWVEVPYFSKSFKGNLAPDARERLGNEFIASCGERGSKADCAHAANAMDYAKAIGMEVFSTSYEEPTGFFDPWHSVYSRVMPYKHQVINAVDADLDPGDEQSVVVLTLDEALQAMEQLPRIDYSEPLRHKRAKHYRALTEQTPGGPLPKQDAEGFWQITWNDELFAKSLGLLSYSRFAFAALIDGQEITPLLDEKGNRLVVYRRAPFKHLYAHMPELE